MNFLLVDDKNGGKMLVRKVDPTPGPWRVTNHHEKLVKVESKNTVICDTLGCDGLNKESLANAHLIAAAPDLLSALRWLTDCISGGLESPEAMDHARPDLEHGIDQARAAIRKAIGGRP